MEHELLPFIQRYLHKLVANIGLNLNVGFPAFLPSYLMHDVLAIHQARKDERNGVGVAFRSMLPRKFRSVAK